MNNHFATNRTSSIAKFFITAITLLFITATGYAADEAPDALVKRVSQDVLNTVKSDKDIQSGNHQKVVELVENKIFPHVDFQRTTSMTAGRYWKQATPEQQQKLANEFRKLLINTRPWCD